MAPLFLRLTALAVLVLLVAGNVAKAQDGLALAVFAFRPKPVMVQLYQPLVDYLNQAVPEARLRLVVLNQEEMEQELGAQRLDLLFTNPSHFIVLRQRNRLTGALATLVAVEQGVAVSSLGGVIITGTRRDDIARLADLRGKTIAIPGTKFLGGYQTQAFELLQAGIRLPDDASLLNVDGHDGVVQTVAAGKADAGFIRTGILEAMIREGRVSPDSLKVVNPQNPPGFPFQLSTRQYPEWAFSALPHVNERVVRRITSALLALEPDHPAAKAASIHGFTIPADYLPVENLARALRLSPFEHAPDFTFSDIISRYRDVLVVLALAGGVIALLALKLVVNNRRLRQAHQRAEESDEVFRRLYEDAPTPVLIIRDGRFERCNRAALDLAGARADQLIGRSPEEISPPFQPDGRSSRDLAREFLDDVSHYSSARFDWVHVRPDGQEFVVEVSLTPITIGGHRLAYVGWTDITDRKRAEAELQAVNQRLAEQAGQLMRVNADLEQFASVASHDLRQPLRMVASYLGLIRRDIQTQASPELREYLGFALDGAKRMDRLIQDLLDYSRSGRHSDAEAPVDFHQAVQEALQHLQPVIDEQGGEVIVAETLPILSGHRGDVVRLFQNLIGNALKYRTPDRPPRVQVGCQRDGSCWRIWVTDNGRGIAEADRERVFKIFQRLVPSSECEGTGIGLAVCKKIVENMGGRIWIDSVPGQGSTFQVSLPVD